MFFLFGFTPMNDIILDHSAARFAGGKMDVSPSRQTAKPSSLYSIRPSHVLLAIGT
jgi:hypothetical protein